VPQTASRTSDEAAIAADLAAGLTYHKAGRLADAVPHYRRVLQARPDHAAANNLLGLVHLASGDSQGAARLLEKAVAAEPDNPQYLCNAAVALDAVLQHEKAAQLLGRAIELKPDYAEAHSNMGLVLKRMDRVFDAADYYRKAISLRPDEPGFHFNLGNVLVDLGQLEEAEAAYRRAIELRPKYASALSALATLLEELGRSDEAAELAGRILDVKPLVRDLAFHRSRGNAYRWVGKLEMAEESFRKALAIDPNDVKTWEALSRTRRRAASEAELEALVRLRRQSSLDPESRILLDLALAQLFDDLGDDATAYEYLRSGNAAARTQAPYSAEQDVIGHQLLQGHFEPVPDDLPQPAPDAPQPIFIVGQPRSGKSTLEGMLARHPRARAAGEIGILRILLRDLMTANGLDKLGSHVRQVPRSRFAELGAGYMDFVRRVVPEGLISIDTMPQNYRFIGLLRLALPNARIVHCRRDPLDHAVALYRKRFLLRGYEYTYDFADLGTHLGLYGNLMSFWHRAFPGYFRDVDVGGLRSESSMRELLAFCGLDWEPACLDFHESEPRLGDNPDFAGARRAERRRFYEPLLRPYLTAPGPLAGGA
jgi:tetratricopeptide (TPR) repeat protein